MWLYLNDKYVEQDKATISPFDRGFLFSDGIYEVVRYYPPRGFFQIEAHLERLQYGLEQLRIRGIDVGKLRPIIEELVARNGHKNAQATAYIQVTRGASFPRQHSFPPPSTPPTLLISTSPFKPHTEEIEKGVRALLEKDIRWSRCDIKTIALLPNILRGSAPLNRERVRRSGRVMALLQKALTPIFVRSRAACSSRPGNPTLFWQVSPEKSFCTFAAPSASPFWRPQSENRNWAMLTNA